jgi:hypothetical protein
VTIKRQRFLPYAYGERRLGLGITEVRAGEEALDLDAVYDDGRRELDLREHAGHTEPVAIGVELDGVDQALLASVLPAGEVAGPPLRFVVVVQDEGGWYRTTAPLRELDGGLRGTLEVVPADSTGVLTVEAIALRTAAASEPDPRFASGRGMRVASSHSLTIRTREPVASPGGALDVRWEDFTKSTHPERKRRSERVFYLEVTHEPPVLWLNQGVPDLRAVLDSKGTHGQRAVIRDLINRTIALPAWYALVHVASLSVTQDEESRPTVPDGWRRGLLARIAPRLHPGVARETAYGRLLEELWALRHEEERDGTELIERMVAAIEDELSLADVARRALRELPR